MAMGPLSVGCAAVGLAGWGPSVSAGERGLPPLATGPSAAPGGASPSAASGASVSVASRLHSDFGKITGRSTVSVMTSPVRYKGRRCAQVSKDACTSSILVPTHTHASAASGNGCRLRKAGVAWGGSGTERELMVFHSGQEIETRFLFNSPQLPLSFF